MGDRWLVDVDVTDFTTGQGVNLGKIVLMIRTAEIRALVLTMVVQHFPRNIVIAMLGGLGQVALRVSFYFS